jgi:hypothetical protein
MQSLLCQSAKAIKILIYCRKNQKPVPVIPVPYPDVMAGLGEGSPGDVKPAIAGEELVGEVVASEEFHKPLKLFGIARADVGCLADEVLRVADTTNEGVNPAVAEARIDYDGADFKAGRFQEHQAAVGQGSRGRFF